MPVASAKPPTPAKTRARRQQLDPTLAYAEDVLAGRVVAGPWVRLAAQRHVEDLRDGPKRGLRFDRELAQVQFDFYRLLQTPEGNPFELIDWQEFVIGSIFGWVEADGFRRFITAYIETGKGSGKSPLLAGIALSGLIIDDEPLPEIYAAATKRDQAKICWGDAVQIYDNSVALSGEDGRPGRCEKFVNNLYCPETGGCFKPISADAKKSSGPRPYIVLADEVHEHPNGDLLRILRAGFKRRRQPLMLEITNSGKNLHSVCYQHHEYSIKVLQRTLQNDTWFAYVCALDEGDDWKNDRRCWPKANPSLACGRIITERYLQDQVDEAKGMPANEATVARLNFCVWSQEDVKAINMQFWNKGGPPPMTSLDELRPSYDGLIEKLRGRRCFGGLDLAKVDDMSAFVLFFPATAEESAYALCWYWCPQDDILARSQRDGLDCSYEVWARFGFLIPTHGNTTDFGFITKKILELLPSFQVEEIAYDRTFAGEVVQALIAEGVKMKDFGQGFYSMGAPTGELLRLVKGGQLHHGGHPVLRLNAASLVTDTDPAGNLKPDKSKSTDRIDGISALCNAIGNSLAAPKEQKVQGGYEVW